MVLVPSICCARAGGHHLKGWVTVSSGLTQWARWQYSTGDPNLPENEPEAPEPDESFARMDTRLQQAPMPGVTRAIFSGQEHVPGLLRDGPKAWKNGKTDAHYT